MAGLFDVLDTASRALQVNQRGLAVAGHNIANVETPGYSRQRQVLTSALPNPDPAGNLGMGVEQVSIERLTDQFTQARLYQEDANLGSLEVERDALAQVESVFNEQNSEGLTTELTALFDGFEGLASSTTPRQPDERAALLGSAKRLVDTIHRSDTQLRGVQEAADRAIRATLPEINAIAERIAGLNTAIVKQEVLAPANDLRDQRDQLLRDLSKKIGTSQFENADGSVVVLIGGGSPLVNGASWHRLEAVADTSNAFDPTFAQVHFVGSGGNFDVTGSIRGGQVGGLLAARDGSVATAIRDLDALAYTLVDVINTQHQTGSGLDPADPGPHDFFGWSGALAGDVNDSARLLVASSAIDPAQGGRLENIAAAKQLPPGNTGDNENAKELARLRNRQAPVGQAGDLIGTGPTGPSYSLLQSASDLIGKVGQSAQSVGQATAQQQSGLREVEDRRDQISGVSIDEEVTDLVRLQAAFQANSRIISSVNRMFDDLVAALG